MIALFHTLFPVFGLIFLGYALVRWRFFDAGVVKGLNSLAYWVGLPAMLISRLANADYSTGGFFWISGTVIGVSLITGVLAWGTARASQIDPCNMGTFLQACLRGNLAFIGLPVVSLTFIPYGTEVVQQMETLVILGLAPIMIFYNLSATTALILSHPHTQGIPLRALFKPLITNPVILASGVGVFIGYFGIPLPAGVARSIDSLGGLAAPLALLCIGCSLFLVPLKGKIRYGFIAAMFKTMVAPLVGVLVCWLLNVEGHVMLIVLILLACPTATVSYIITRQLGGDEALASSSIVISSLLSLFTLSVVILVTGMIGMEYFLP